MAGAKGCSGGRRQGAGRPPQTVTLKQGATVLVFEKYQGQPVMRESGQGLALAKVSIERRGEFRLTLPDGTEFFIKA